MLRFTTTERGAGGGKCFSHVEVGGGGQRAQQV